MDLETLLETRGPAVTERALASLSRSHLRHYESLGAARTTELLAALYDVTVRTVRTRDAGPMLRHVETIGRERFRGGFDLIEVQTAFNALEESLWREITGCIPADKLAEALGLVATALGIGKDALAREFVAQATQGHAPTLDLRSLFAGT